MAPGEKFSFDWAFLGNDLSPYNDFSLFYLKDPHKGAIVFSELLAQIGSPPGVPIAAILLLLDVDDAEVLARVRLYFRRRNQYPAQIL